MLPLTDALRFDGVAGAAGATVVRAAAFAPGAPQPGVVMQLHVTLGGGAGVATIANAPRDASTDVDGAAGFVRLQAAAEITATPATIR
ncbi:MAG: hypothetical protein LAO77_00560 [Acidobacteriia bacterium]|nr:hypothetical protein [Terriglobia bacterium]